VALQCSTVNVGYGYRLKPVHEVCHTVNAATVVLHIIDIIIINCTVCMCVILVPIDRTGGINMLYVFVDIKIDSLHFIQTLQHNFAPGTHLALVSTIQFVPTLQVS